MGGSAGHGQETPQGLGLWSAGGTHPTPTGPTWPLLPGRCRGPWGWLGGLWGPACPLCVHSASCRYAEAYYVVVCVRSPTVRALCWE